MSPPTSRRYRVTVRWMTGRWMPGDSSRDRADDLGCRLRRVFVRGGRLRLPRGAFAAVVWRSIASASQRRPSSARGRSPLVGRGLARPEPPRRARRHRRAPSVVGCPRRGRGAASRVKRWASRSAPDEVTPASDERRTSPVRILALSVPFKGRGNRWSVEKLRASDLLEPLVCSPEWAASESER